jgi:hypothetical protein
MYKRHGEEGRLAIAVLLVDQVVIVFETEFVVIVHDLLGIQDIRRFAVIVPILAAHH